MEKFKALSLDELCQSLCENKKTLIVFHVRSDADAVGSAFALRELLRVMGIQSYCACSDELPEKLSFPPSRSSVSNISALLSVI